MPRESLDNNLYDEDGNKICKICGKKLRPLTKSKDWETRCYHITCFQDLIKDIYKYDKVAYKKYGHKKKINGSVFVEDFVNSNKPIVIEF